MLTIRLEGAESAARHYEALAKNQLPFARSKAANDLAFLVREKEMETAAKVFDRPKPQTVKNFFVRKATKQNPVAQIWFDQIYNRGYEEYMVPEVEGGSRKMKPSEQRLGHFYVPGIGAKLDKYGNMQGGQITQVLSQLGRFGDVAGYDMNQTARSKGRRARAKKSTEYFIVTQKTGGLVPGIYQRTSGGMGPFQKGASPWFTGKTSRTLPPGAFQKGRSSGPFSSVIRGRGVIPVVIFTKGAPSYKALFPFYKVAQQVIDQNYRRLLGDAIDYALRTAK